MAHARAGMFGALGSSTMRCRDFRAAKRGFTLAELLAVVAIVSILAVLAVYGVRKYVFAAKSSEAIHMIGLIKTAQENFRDETFSFLPVSSSLNSYYPAAAPGRVKRAWNNPGGNDAQNWRLLGVEADAPVEFVYSCIAGGAADAVPVNLGTESRPAWSWPNTNEPWYIVKAVADRDEDGRLAIFIGSSFTSEVFAENEAE